MQIRRCCCSALVLVLVSACASMHASNLAAPQRVSGACACLPKHTFRPGEVFEYVFENTKARYVTTSTNAIARPTELTSLEEIAVSINQIRGLPLLSDAIPVVSPRPMRP
jgi:hypothetical protein